MINRRVALAITLVLLSSVIEADIYMYEDEDGRKHFVNRPVEKGRLVKGISPISTLDDDEDVQALLSAPRFNREVSLHGDASAFVGNYPKPFSLRNDTVNNYANILEKQRGAFKGSAGLAFANRSLYDPYIEQIGRKHGVDPALIHAVITVESAYNPHAISHAGAMGLMQLMPLTAKRFGVTDAYDPIQNIEGGVMYLRFLLDKFGNLPLALAGYNAGEGSVMKYNNQIPPYKETQAYVPKVLGYYQRYLEGQK